MIANIISMTLLENSKPNFSAGIVQYSYSRPILRPGKRMLDAAGGALPPELHPAVMAQVAREVLTVHAGRDPLTAETACQALGYLANVQKCCAAARARTSLSASTRCDAFVSPLGFPRCMRAARAAPVSLSRPTRLVCGRALSSSAGRSSHPFWSSPLSPSRVLSTR